MLTTIVSTAELERHLDDPTWVILDCQHDLLDHAFGRKSYELGHIPGAHFVSMEADMAGYRTGSNGRHPLPTVESLEAVFSRLGVAQNRQVIVYDNAQNNYAGRVWWTLRYLGHDAVAVLDGGLGKWTAESRPLSTDTHAPLPTVFNACADAKMVVDAATIMAQIGKPGIQVIDARNTERYSGDVETIDPVGGHIPGALLRFWKDNVSADGSYKDPELLRTEFLQLLGDVPLDQVVHQCGSGVSACNNMIAMEIAGLKGTKLYVGSWSEWCSDRSRPIATGNDPFGG